MQLDLELRALVERQHGVIARRQARELGAGSEHLRRRIESPDWEALTPNVLRLVGARRTFRQRCMAAALDVGAGAAVSHESAAALWRLPGFPTVTHACQPGERAVLADDGAPDERARGPGPPVRGNPGDQPGAHDLRPRRRPPPGRAERALDNALGRRLTTVPALRQVTEELARRGRPGTALMRRLLADRDDSYRAPESNLEARFESVLADAGVRVPLRQCEVGGDDWTGRVDYLDPERRVVLEIDSDLHHSTLLDAGADARRDAALTEAGYTVVRIKERDLWHRPEEVVRQFLAS